MIDIYNIPPVNIKDCWQTPPELKEYIYKKFGVNGEMFDPCPVNPKVNGLLIDWKSPAFVNPPYSRGNQIQWVKKGVEQVKKGVISYFLIPSDTSTKLWHDYVMRYAKTIYFIKGRIKFVGATGMPKFGNALVVFRNHNSERNINIYTLDWKK